jgi:hypothetical protein
MPTDKYVSSFVGATEDLVKGAVEDTVLQYIKTNWDNNFDWDGISAEKPQAPSNQIYWFQWWSHSGPLSIESSNTYTTTTPVELGVGMDETRTTVRLDLFARGSQTAYPIRLATASRFIRQLIAKNPRALESSGIHEIRMLEERGIPDDDPKSSVYHYTITLMLLYSHMVVNI